MRLTSSTAQRFTIFQPGHVEWRRSVRMTFELNRLTFNIFHKTVAVFGWIFELRRIVVCENTNKETCVGGVFFEQREPINNSSSKTIVDK